MRKSLDPLILRWLKHPERDLYVIKEYSTEIMYRFSLECNRIFVTTNEKYPENLKTALGECVEFNDTQYEIMFNYGVKQLIDLHDYPSESLIRILNRKYPDDIYGRLYGWLIAHATSDLPSESL